MHSLGQTLSSIFSLRTLAAVTALAMALLVGVVGPELMLDGHRPLASAGVRLTLIALLVAWTVLWLVKGPTGLVGVAALGLAVWHAGALVVVGNARPLESVGMRAALVGVVILACAGYWLYRLWQALRSDDDLLTRFLGRDRATGGPREAARVELRAVAEAMRRAVAQLRGLRLRGGWRRVFERRRHLYELPWYLVIGSPGAGKTSALLNAGLRFPGDASDPAAGAPARRMALQSPEGTLHCDWWLANEAVFIDTAGRYTTQDSDPQADPAEWLGFLALLRRQRPRAPINGAVVVFDIAALLSASDAQRAAHAARVRHRLAELRGELGIRFPVYVIVTKLDLLRGFTEYFHSLTSEGRTQVWGFTRPVDERHDAPAEPVGVGQPSAPHSRIDEELSALQLRLEDGLRSRLDEEFDVDRRRRLFALPGEFAGLVRVLKGVLDATFLPSRFDATEDEPMLRGVYFTSAAQAEVDISADPRTLLQRLRQAMGLSRDRDRDRGQAPGGEAAADARGGGAPARAHRGYFLHDLFLKVIVAEAHLVRPNLRWEVRFRLLRFLGHALAIVAFAALTGALVSSFQHNRDYLASVGQRLERLAGQLDALRADFRPSGVPDVLAAARELPVHPMLDVSRPTVAPASFSYGLYSAAPVIEAAARGYARLQEQTMLPSILQRMEDVMGRSVREDDTRTAYETLRVYRLLHDDARYARSGNARAVRDWVVGDWERGDGTASFGGRADMRGHVDTLFSGERIVTAASRPNEALVREVQRLLDGRTFTERLYERARSALRADAPQDFTLLRAVGLQAGTMFSRVGARSLDQGVPGLFTFDGYHGLFAPRLAAFVRDALDDDAWVMGRTDAARSPGAVEAAIDDVRRQYLNDYARHWEEFLASVRPVGQGAPTAEGLSTGLGVDLGVLRQFAAPDSPLARLARAAVRETTLSIAPTSTDAATADSRRGLLERAADALGKAPEASAASRRLIDADEARTLARLVDSRFAALREVVTGSPDAVSQAPASSAPGTFPTSPTSPTSAGRPGLDAVTGIVNEFYTVLAVADNALAAGSLPVGGQEVGARLRLEADKLPAPLREVLLGLAASGSAKVTRGSAGILRRQAQEQVDRLVGLLAVQVGEPCRRGIEGRYPMAPGPHDASIDDFTRLFASGGAFDDFFGRHLAPFVDTGSRPWRYRSPEGALAIASAGPDAGGDGRSPRSASTSMPAPTPIPTPGEPTLAGEQLRLLARQGPDLDAFYRARQIRDAFFGEAGGRKLGWKLDLKVVELDPSITDLVIDVDGQGQRYAHGPVQALSLTWPGPRGGAVAELTANPRVSGPTSTALANGPWALLRLLERGRIVDTALAGRLNVEYVFDGRRALLEIVAASQASPLGGDLLRGFRCPGRAG